jgi:hypothetical protein
MSSVRMYKNMNKVYIKPKDLTFISIKILIMNKGNVGTENILKLFEIVSYYEINS